jgi:hypothetical protein
VSRLYLALCVPLFIAGTLVQAEEAPLGRLFFTPSERVTLEELRRKAQAPKLPEVERKVGVIKPHATVRFSGMVKRSDGVSAIWVNGKHYYGSERPNDIGLLSREGSDAISVKLPESDKRVPLRVGQDMDATSGIVVERYTLREVAGPATGIRSNAKKRTAKAKPLTERPDDASNINEDDESARGSDGR